MTSYSESEFSHSRNKSFWKTETARAGDLKIKRLHVPFWEGFWKGHFRWVPTGSRLTVGEFSVGVIGLVSPTIQTPLPTSLFRCGFLSVCP
jgi:hypothetical protein